MVVSSLSLLDFAGRVAIVTGAGRGLGRSHALMLASRGARVVINDLKMDEATADPAAEVVKEITTAGGIAVADHSNVVTGASALIQTALANFGQLDIVINNAGVSSFANFGDADPAEWHTVFDIHLRGTVEVCRAAWPHLVRSGAGRIVNTASNAMLGNAGLTSYSSAKAGIVGFTRSLALDGEKHNLFSNVIMPCAWTRMSAVVENPQILATLQTRFQVEHVSSFVVWLVHQQTGINNEIFQVSGGRAGRMTMAAYPTVRVNESTPEVWSGAKSKLFSPGELTPFHSMAEMLENEFASADSSYDTKTNNGSLGLPAG